MHEAPTIDSDIHVHSIKASPQRVWCQPAEMDQLHGMRKDSGAFFKEPVQIASNQPRRLTRSTKRCTTAFLFFCFFFQEAMVSKCPYSVEKSRHDTGGICDSGGERGSASTELGGEDENSPFISCLDT